MEAERRLQIRAGVFTLVVLAALAGVVMSLTREGGLFTPRYTLYADFNNIEGLLPNARVLLAGNDVGRVRDIYFLGPDAGKAIRVVLDLDAAIQDRIREDSVASIYPKGFLGDVRVAISLGSESARMIPDQGGVSTLEPFSFADLYRQGDALIENLVGVSGAVRRVVGDFEESMAGETLASTLGSLRNIVHEIETGQGLLHSLVYERSDGAPAEIQATLVELRGSVQRLSAILAEIEQGDGMLHQLVYGSGEEMSTLAAVGQSAQRLESVLRKLDEGEGSLGALINDPSLYEELRLLVSGARDSALLRTLIDYVRPDDDGR